MEQAARHSAWEVLGVFARLGVTSFGGPIAHLGYFRDEFVVRRRWLSDREYADLVALCQFLPGPASSQVGFAVGLARAGLRGALAAFAAFTLPSAVLMVAFAYGISLFDSPLAAGALAGLKIVAVAIVAQAVWGMARTLTPDPVRAAIAVVAAILALLLAGPLGLVSAMVVGALGGLVLCRTDAAGAGAVAADAGGADAGSTDTGGADAGSTDTGTLDADGAGTVAVDAGVRFPVSRAAGVACLVLFFVGLFALPVLAGAGTSGAVALFDAFYRAGALVFGGGHVVLPLLEAGVVAPGWVGESAFLAGYGAAQAVPGPLFTFAAYLGALSSNGPGGVGGAAVALVAVFLPGFLLLLGILPFWNALRTGRTMHALMRGANAAVVGILAAALYTPVFTSAVTGPGAFALALVAFVLLVRFRLPPWVVVLVGAAGGVLLAVTG